MVRTGLGVLLAAIAMFFWGFAYWGSGLVDPHTHVPEQTDNALLSALTSGLPETGVYFLPDPKVGTEASWQARMAKGPIATIIYHKAGGAAIGVTMGLGFLHMLVTAALLALLLRMTLPAAPAYLHRLKIAAAAGAAAAVYAYLGNPIWWHYPWSFAITGAVYDFISYVVAGAVLAYFIRPQTA